MIDSEHFRRIMDERMSVCEELRSKNRPLHAFLEFAARLFASSCNNVSAIVPNKTVCHFYHDNRLAKFGSSCTGDSVAVDFCTDKKSIRLLRFQLRLCWRIAAAYRRLRTQIKPMDGLSKLSLLDLAMIDTLIQQYGVNRFHVAAHFQPYVVLLSELRNAEIIRGYTGRQHGAWERSPLENMQHRLHFDRYQLLDQRFEAPFRQYINGNQNVQIEADSLQGGIAWESNPSTHLAVAFQDDNYEADFKILSVVNEVCKEAGIELIVYPHPRTSELNRAKIASVASIETKKRYHNSVALVTRYSTLGFQFALNGRDAVFTLVDHKEIVFDRTGLKTHIVAMGQLGETIERILASTALPAPNMSVEEQRT